MMSKTTESFDERMGKLAKSYYKLKYIMWMDRVARTSVQSVDDRIGDIHLAMIGMIRGVPRLLVSDTEKTIEKRLGSWGSCFPRSAIESGEVSKSMAEFTLKEWAEEFVKVIREEYLCSISGCDHGFDGYCWKCNEPYCEDHSDTTGSGWREKLFCKECMGGE